MLFLDMRKRNLNYDYGNFALQHTSLSMDLDPNKGVVQQYCKVTGVISVDMPYLPRINKLRDRRPTLQSAQWKLTE
jgi:hypothetical protein